MPLRPSYRPTFRTGPLAAVLGWLILVWLVGPWALLAGFALLGSARFRWWIRPDRPWSLAGGLAASALVVAGLVVVIPDGWLPLPPGIGVAVEPSYVGRAATARPVNGYDVPPHPGLSANGTNSMHNDAWASDAYGWAGPMGDRVEVDTAWYGVEECATLAFDREGRLIALCGDLEGPTLHVIDPESMRKQASLELPPRPGSKGKRPWEDLCGGAYFYLDADDRAVVATTDRRIVVATTSDTEGRPELVQVDGFDLSGSIPADDCLVALLPDAQARIWFVTQGGRVGTVDTTTRQAHVHELDEEISNSFALADDAAYVVSETALHRFEAGPAGRPRVAWRTPYDRGTERKPGQLGQGSGTTPTLLADGMVAITDNAEPRMNVVFLRRRDGAEICRAPVFDDDASATENSLVGLGRGVVVENNHGYRGPQSTLLGATTEGGMARVDVVDGACEVRWTNPDVVAPTSVPKVSLATGLLYAYTKPGSWWGVSGWHLTAVDVHTGRRVFSVRTGIGLLANNHYAAVTIAPDGALFIATLGGLVRVRDRAVG